MKRCVFLPLLMFSVLVTLATTSEARRGNPMTNASASLQMYLIDSDDNHPDAPTYRFVDTSYNYAQWTRLPNPSNLDEATMNFTAGAGWSTNFFSTQYNMLEAAVTTNGVFALRIPQGSNLTISSGTNRRLPTQNFIDTFTMVAALWADFEMRNDGDSSKIFYRVTSDSVFVSYYELALKGTHGKVRATFQIVITKDTSITVHYRSFDGSYAGRTAEELIQNLATIGIQSRSTQLGTMYLHRGQYYAHSAGSAQYAKDLHDGLAIRFKRYPNHKVRAINITSPAYDRFELSSSTITMTGVAQNTTSQQEMMYITFTAKNLTTGITIFSKLDSFLAYADLNTSYTTTYQGLPCGAYQLTMNVWIPRVGEDVWTFDNSITRTFFVLNNSTSIPLYEQFNGALSGCTWASMGAEVQKDDEVMYDPPAPRSANSNSLVLDRRDLAGNRYNDPNAGDTLVSSPINLAGKSNIWLTFSYQRGIKGQNLEGGIQQTLRVGPERSIVRTTGGLAENADTLLVEGLLSTGSRWNPSAAAWTILRAIPGSVDLTSQKIRLQLPSNVISDHFRLRFRLKSQFHDTWIAYPHEDFDGWVIDGIQITAPANGQTEFEVTRLELGNGPFTHVPRDIRFLRPRVNISNNARNAGLGSFVVRLVLRDQLNREVYHKSQAFAMPESFSDTLIYLPDWDIKGSQGGVFSGRTTIESAFADIYHTNDTNTFQRTLHIDDVFALDDGTPDTIGTQTTAPSEWHYDFISLTDDSLRGIDIYYLGPQSATTWQLVAKHEGVQIATRATTITPLGAGWYRGTFNPIKFPKDTVRLHFRMTVGANQIGGDASRALFWEVERNADGVPTKVVAQYPDVLNNYYLVNEAPYYTNVIAQGGSLVPMFRLVYSGSATYLPVELVRFVGKRTAANDVELSWRTAKEEQVNRFEIERAAGDDWMFVASTGARGGKQGAEYQAIDRNTSTDALRYRLMEHDLDGSSKVLGHVHIGPMGSAASGLLYYPNPTRDLVRLESLGGNPLSIKLLDVLGRGILEVPASVGSAAVEISVGHLAAGSYYIEARYEDGVTLRYPLTITK